MLHAFASLKCSKKCQHNVQKPSSCSLARGVLRMRTSRGIICRYLSNRPQVSEGYRLINHAGCWQNTGRIGKPRAGGEWFTNSWSVLPTFQVVYQPITHRNVWSIAFIFYSVTKLTGATQRFSWRLSVNIQLPFR